MYILKSSDGIFPGGRDYLGLEADVFELFVNCMGGVNKRSPVAIDDVTFNYARTIVMVADGNGSIEPEDEEYTRAGDQFLEDELRILNHVFGSLFQRMAHVQYNRPSKKNVMEAKNSDKCVRFEEFGNADNRGVPYLLRALANGIESELSRNRNNWYKVFRDALSKGYSTPNEIRALVRRHWSTYDLRDMLLVFHWFFNGVKECDKQLSLEQRFRKMTNRQRRACMSCDFPPLPGNSSITIFLFFQCFSEFSPRLARLSRLGRRRTNTVLQ